MRILVTGKNGQVGSEFSRLYQSPGDVVSVGRDDCDLSSQQSIRDLVQRIKPAVVVNAAAYTAVDKAEEEPELCFAINAVAPRVLAEEAARLDALLIHYSTDYVFNGEKPEPYLESDPISPVSVYGASKAAGEAAIAETASRYLVLRTSWVYGAQGNNFLRTMLRLGAERSELRVVDDQVGAPTSAAAIATATARLVEIYAAPGAHPPAGIYHMTAGGSTSWCGFARAIFSAALLSAPPRVQAIPSSEYPTPARRPANSVLANEKFAHAFAFRLPPWEQQLQQVLAGMQVASRIS
jgi:dTDP-4-dehydrorhamnose reductase